jgi:AraC family transcriptional regulator
MDPAPRSDFDRILFESGLVRIGAFRCNPDHVSFHDSGPARNFCFVFPRTAVQIQHEHESAFVANPNVVTFYNRGQAYLRSPISPDGDRCDWFGADRNIVLDVVRALDPDVEARPEMPFRFTHGWSDSSTYLLQRRFFERVARGALLETLQIEEFVIFLLERVARSVYRSLPRHPTGITSRQRDIVRHAELIISNNWGERLTLGNISREVGTSAYHLCRLFRRLTGTTLHQYRQKLHLRWSLESVVESERPLVDIALDAGFSSHSHFTSSFHREFAGTPSGVRRQRAIF